MMPEGQERQNDADDDGHAHHKSMIQVLKRLSLNCHQKGNADLCGQDVD